MFVGIVIHVLMFARFANVLVSEGFSAELNQPVGLMALILASVVGFIMNGFFLSLGIDFAKKVDAKLLLLDGHYSFMKDIFNPAVVVGALYAGAVLIVNAVLPSPSLSVFFYEHSGVLFYKSFFSVFSILGYDVSMFLFSLCGIALLIKKITKNISVTAIDHVSVVLVAVLHNIVPWLWKFGTVFMIDPIIGFATDMVLGVLFWKKGFETAVLCHFVIAIILYAIAPAVLLFASA